MTKDEIHDAFMFMPDGQYMICMYWAMPNTKPDMYGTLAGFIGDPFTDPYKAKELCKVLDRFADEWQCVIRRVHNGRLGFYYSRRGIPYRFNVVPCGYVKTLSKWFDLADAYGDEHGTLYVQSHVTPRAAYFLHHVVKYIDDQTCKAYDTLLSELEKSKYV